MSETTKEVEKLEEVNAAVKDAAPGEATHLKNDAVDMGAPVVKPTDKNPDAASKAKQNTSDPALKSAKDGSNPAGKGDMKPTSMKEEEVEIEATEDQEVVAEEETKEVEIDLSADVKALVSADADLSEEFKEKAATIFETAVKTRIKEQTKILESQYEDKLSKETDTVKEAMVEKVDSYLNYVVEEWMKENELAVERGIRTEIAEDFITGLKSLFKEHYIDVPEEKYNVLDDLTNQTKDLESKLNEQIEKNVELTKTNSEFSRASLVSEVSADLAETEKEKFVSMAENVDFDSAEKFKEKLETVKESFFPKTKSEITENSVDSVAANVPSDFTNDQSDAMAAYTAAITKDISYGVK
jgi:hypothetical protein